MERYVLCDTILFLLLLKKKNIVLMVRRPIFFPWIDFKGGGGGFPPSFAELQLPLSLPSTSPHHNTTHVSLMACHCAWKKQRNRSWMTASTSTSFASINNNDSFLLIIIVVNATMTTASVSDHPLLNFY